jgi:signal peptidase I
MRRPMKPGGFFRTWERVLTGPQAFFGQGLPLASGTRPLIFYFVVHGVNALGSGILYAQETGAALMGAVVAPLLLVGRLFELFVLGSILGLGARWLGGSGSPESGRAVYAYASAPYVFGFIPYIGWLAVVVWLFVLVIGMARHHGLSYGRAIVATALPLAAPVALAVPLALTLRFFVIEAFKIPSASMAPAIAMGDHVFVKKLAYGAGAKTLPPRGDVIVFQHPDPTTPPADYVKRVIGLPGDTIRTEGPKLFVNGWEVPSCDVGVIPDPGRPGHTLWAAVEYLDGAAYVVVHDEGHFSDGEWRVGPGEVFVVGDNRENSADSRSFFIGKGGGVPLDHVKGLVWIIWWSNDRSDIGRNVASLSAPAGLDASGRAAFARCVASRPPRSRTTPPPPGTKP